MSKNKEKLQDQEQKEKTKDEQEKKELTKAIIEFLKDYRRGDLEK